MLNSFYWLKDAVGKELLSALLKGPAIFTTSDRNYVDFLAINATVPLAVALAVAVALTLALALALTLALTLTLTLTLNLALALTLTLTPTLTLTRSPPRCYSVPPRSSRSCPCWCARACASCGVASRARVASASPTRPPSRWAPPRHARAACARRRRAEG